MELNEKGLLAINLSKRESWDLLDLVRKKKFKVQAVETREGRRNREQDEKVQEEVTVERESAGMTRIHLDEESEREAVDNEESEVDSLADGVESLVDGEAECDENFPTIQRGQSLLF